MAPSYVPLAQQRAIMSHLGSTMQPQPQISYLDFLATHNRQSPQSPMQIGPQGVNPSDVMTSMVKDQGMNYLKDYLPSMGSSAASSAGSTAGMSMMDGSMMAGGQELGGMSLMNGGTAAVDASGNIIASSGATIPGPFSLNGIGSAGNGILPLAGVAGMYDLFKSNRGANNRFGGGLQGAASGAAMGSYFGPVGIGVGALAGGIYGATQHESTRDRAKRVTKELGGKSKDPTYQAYVRGMREQYNSGPKDPSKPFAGKYKNWEDYVKGGLEASDLTGVEGNIKQYGEEWAKATQAQREAVTKKNIEKGIYDSKDGGVRITNEDLAKQSWDEIMKNPGANTASIMIPKARSPGFDKNGKRINYAR